MFQGGEAEYMGEHGQTLALREICVEFIVFLQVALGSREWASDLLLKVKI
jgi:hypothetical protein